MISYAAVIGMGGPILWECPQTPQDLPRGRVLLNAMVAQALMQQRAGSKDLVVDAYRIVWSIDAEAAVVAAVVSPKVVPCHGLDELARKVRTAFVASFGPRTKAPFVNVYEGFDATYAPLARAVALQDDASLVAGAAAVDSTTAASTKDVAPPTTASDGALVTASGKVVGKRASRGSGAAAAKTPAAPPTTAKRTKEQRAKGGVGTVTDSATPAEEAPSEDTLAQAASAHRHNYVRIAAGGETEKVQEKDWGQGRKRGVVASWLRSRFGSRTLDAQDFEQVLPPLREKLISKNVAVSIVDAICDSLTSSLTGKKLGTLESLPHAIEEALEETLHRLLRPREDIDVLRSIDSARGRRRPWTVVFCGVNGVGKSTSLAKVAFWVKQQGMSLMIAAADTFRHGAVEQLEVHGRVLGVSVFNMGYGTDPSAVATAAVAHATRTGIEAVLIDTAGRMQDHESRMRALAKLIHDVNPDLVLFVGEALVGNNGVDQLRKFNTALEEFAPAGHRPRGIDGIVLTKFDTIDDKVGAAVSMVHELGQPIVFVGVGQMYQDLKVLDAQVVVTALMQ